MNHHWFGNEPEIPSMNINCSVYTACITYRRLLVVSVLNVSVQESRYSKMEKADILEMTVAYLQSTYRRVTDSTDDSTYAAGYRQCALEVAHYLANVACRSNCDGLVVPMQAKLMRHLSAILQTKLLSPPDDASQLSPFVTPFPPEPEVRTRNSCDSSDISVEDGCGRVCSPVSPSPTPNDEASTSPASSHLVDEPLCGSPPLCVDQSTQPVIVDHVQPSSVSADDARSTDSCVWRPW